MKENLQENEQRARNIINASLFAAIAGVVLVIAGVMTFFWGRGTDTLFTYIAQIGDVTGGVGGTILNFTAILIVYYSLREQLRSNIIQSEALQNEIGRSKYENKVRTIERSIGSAKQEFDRQHNKLSEWSKLVQQVNTTLEDFYNEVEFNKMLRTLKDYEENLSVLAALLLIANKQIEDTTLEVDDKSYCIDLFYRSCIEVLRTYRATTHAGRAVNYMSLTGLYLNRIANEYEHMRYQFYQDKLKDEPKYRS